ncbi:MAG TPA: CoA-binding protein [Desulfonatronum sp.]|nr:CoA-binding protein [Desulfonatronum sp.]
MFNLAELASRLTKVKTIAVLGAKDVTGRPVDRVGRYLIAAGFRVFPVHPVRRDVWGLPTFAALHHIPEPVDAVDVFRAARFCPDHARECLALDPLPLMFWMQSGIVSVEARRLLEPAGVFVVEDRCLMVEHQRLFPDHD